MSMDNKITALYCRTSTDKQSKGLEAQATALLDYCKRNNITNYILYQDFGISGAVAVSSRPQLKQLMDACNAGTISAVICYSFSRFARSTKHLLAALEEFQSLGIRFISITEQIDTNSAIGNAFFTIVAAMAQLERELISERVKCGLNNAKSKGKHLGRPKVYDNSKLILELCSKGYSYSEVAKLTSCSPATVCRIMKKELHKPPL